MWAFSLVIGSKGAELRIGGRSPYIISVGKSYANVPGTRFGELMMK